MYKGNDMYVEDVKLQHVVDKVRTPCYVYSHQIIKDNVHRYENAITKAGLEATICYAVKANSNLAILQLLASLGIGFDVVSVGELERVIKAGGDVKKVVFSGVGKQCNEIIRALKVGIKCINIESESELYYIQQVAQSIDIIAPISLRINPDVDAKTHPYISTGLKNNKFGIAIEQAPRVYEIANNMSHINIIGVDCHIGSQLLDMAPFIDSYKRLLHLIDTLTERGIVLEHFDIGGGIGIAYKEDDIVIDLDEIFIALKKLNGERKLHFILEPGRSIIGNAGMLLTKILYLKETEHSKFAICDSGMNDLLRPALYQAYHNVKPINNNKEGKVEKNWDLVGPVCESSDFLAKGRLLYLKQHDIVAIMDSGAYGSAMSSNYNSRCRIPEILVKEDKIFLIRKREEIQDMWSHEFLL